MKVGKLINSSLAHFGVKLVRLNRQAPTRPGNAYALDLPGADGIDIEVKKLLNLVAYVKANITPYNADEFTAGYQTLRIDDHEFIGQRDSEQRLEGVPFDFNGASVLDLGCNRGDMLLSIANRIKAGVGVDYDYRLVNAANRIRSHKLANNVNFYVFDLEDENLELLRNFVEGNTVDIVFLLSICRWLKGWKGVIDIARSLSNTLLFESNGSVEQQDEQVGYLRTKYPNVLLVSQASVDVPIDQRKRLLLCNANGPDHARVTHNAK